MKRLQQLWRGEVSLARTYWLWGALGGNVGIGLVGAFLVGIVIRLTGFLFIFYVYMAFMSVYGFFIAVAIWRSAGYYEGPRGWAIAARILVVLGVPVQIAQLISSTVQL